MNKWKEIQKSIKTAKEETKKSENDAVSPRKSRLNKHACMESQRLNRIHDLQSRFSHLLDQEKCKFSTVERLPWYILNPSSMTRIGWDFMLILFLVYIAIVTPYRIGFDTSSDDITTVVFESLMDVFFLIDITLNFFAAVPVGESLKEGLVVDLKSIAKRYVSGYFLIDIFSSIPFDLINALSGNSETSSVGQIDSAKTVKTSKISKFIRLAKFTKLARLARGVKIFKRLFDFAALISHGYFVFARILISTFFIVHLNACAFGYITTNDDTAYQRTWMDDWDPTLKTSPAWRTYLSCLSFSFSIMISGEGGGIQNAQGNDLEMMIVLLFAVTSGVYYMYVAATITALLTAADMKNTLYREKMDALLHYMKTRRFPKDLYLKVLRYFKFFYSEHAIAEEEDILASMNTSLRTQVTSFLSHGIFTNTHLFADFKEDIYGMLLPLLKTMHIHMHDTIFLAGSFGDEMYIIRSGEVKGMVPSVVIAEESNKNTDKNDDDDDGKNQILNNVRNASFRLRSMMKRIKRINKLGGRVSPKHRRNDEDNKNDTNQALGTGTLYHFTDGMLFGELVCCQVIPKRIYDAVAMVDTELYHISAEDIFRVFQDNHYSYVIQHLTRIANQHLSYLKEHSKLANYALERYKMATFSTKSSSFFSRGNDDNKSSGNSKMGTALMNLIRKKKVDKKKNASSSLSAASEAKNSEMLEKIFVELKNVSNEVKSFSKRLNALERVNAMGRVSRLNTTSLRVNVNSSSNMTGEKMKKMKMEKKKKKYKSLKHLSLKKKDEAEDARYAMKIFDSRRTRTNEDDTTESMTSTSIKKDDDSTSSK